MKQHKTGSAKSTPRAKPSPAKAKPRRAVFLDRDGTVCEEVGYMNHIRRLEMLPGAAKAIRTLNRRGIPVVLVTNQSGVSRGFFPEKLVHSVHRKLTQLLRRQGARLAGVYYCPHQKADGCSCRKPLPGMLQQAAREHNLQLEGSWVVSDRYADVQMSHAVGGLGALVMSGYGRGEYTWNRKRWARPPDVVAEDLASAVRAILRRWK